MEEWYYIEWAAPITKNFLVQNINSANVKKPCQRECNLESRPQRGTIIFQNHQIILSFPDSQSSSPLFLYCWFCCTTVHHKLTGHWVLDRCSVSAVLHLKQGEGWFAIRIWKFMPFHLPFYLPFQSIFLWSSTVLSSHTCFLIAFDCPAPYVYAFFIVLPIQNYLFFSQSLLSKIPQWILGRYEEEIWIITINISWNIW